MWRIYCFNKILQRENVDFRTFQSSVTVNMREAFLSESVRVDGVCLCSLPSSRLHDQTLGLPALPLLWAALWGLGHAGLPADQVLSSGSRGELGGGRYGGDGGGPDHLGGGEERKLQQLQRPDPEPGELDERRGVLLQGQPSWPPSDPDHPQEPV